MSTATARAYQPRFAGRFVPFEMQKSPQNKAFYGHWSTYSGKAHCIKDSVLLDGTCENGGFLTVTDEFVKPDIGRSRKKRTLIKMRTWAISKETGI
ncbi:MAG: hypothetical protein ACOX8T_07425 [Bacillota bacterium]|jgi:hypothetical protein